MKIQEIRERQLEVGSKITKVPCTCMGADVVMHSMSSAQHEVYMQFCQDHPHQKQAKLIQICMHDEDGKQCWDPKDIPQLSALKIEESAVEAALVANGWAEAGEEEIVKNSPETSGDDGSSEQPESTESPSTSS